MRFSTVIPASALALAFAVGGCGDATGSSAPITMTDPEVSNLFGEINGEVFAGMGFTGMSRANPGVTANLSAIGRAPSFDATGLLGTISYTGICKGGGSAVATGTATGTATGSNATGGSFDVTETFTQCTSTHYKLDGSFHTAGTFTAASGDTFTEHLTTDGSFALTVLADGRVGTCAVNFTTDVTVHTSTSGVTSIVSGTICGRSVQATL